MSVQTEVSSAVKQELQVLLVTVLFADVLIELIVCSGLKITSVKAIQFICVVYTVQNVYAA